MIGDVDSIKSTSGYLTTFARGGFMTIKIAKMYCIIYYRN